MACVVIAWSLVAAALVAGGARASAGVVVVQMQLVYEQTYELPLNSSIEYILDVAAAGEGAGGVSVPSVVWARSDGGDSAHPVLVTARHRAGAVTWQLPYADGARALHELERTLCPADTAAPGAASDCGEGAVRDALTLHVSTSCARGLMARVRVSRPPLWALPFAQPVLLVANMSAPRTTYYRFLEGQHSVRLVASSETDFCAVLAVQNYSCPIAQTAADLSSSGLRMTMMRSGAVQLSRSDYPLGFLVVVLVLPSQASCGEEEGVQAAWLWAAALLGDEPQHKRLAAREKDFLLTVEPALTRGQYAAAAVTLLLVFLVFYALVGALVLAQRWAPLAKYVLPKAVLADTNHGGDASVVEEAQVSRLNGSIAVTTPARLRRRGSDATFDSSDNSDSDEEDERQTRAVAASTPTATSVSITSGSPVSSPTLASISATATVPASVSAPAAESIQNGVVQDPQQIVVVQSVNDGVDTQNPQQISQVDEIGTQITEHPGPFGLPARLRLAALARRRARTLRARSDRYLHTLCTVAVFYALPVVQFVIAFQIVLNMSGSLDICYYNFLCAHSAGALSDFNHVFSNLGYLLLGALFLLQVRRRRLRRKRRPRHPEYGIPAHYGLLSALGAGMMVVAVLSASYHICPNRLNFQFDTSFMYVLAVLIMVKIYQSRHPDVNARAHATFAVLAVLIALVVWGVLDGGALFWGVFTVLHVFTFLLLSLRIYFVGQFRLEKESLATAASSLRQGTRPLYRARLIMLVAGNALNWAFAAYGLLRHGSDFAGHMLQVLLGNALVYMGFYLGMKIVHGERLRAYAWVLLAAAAAAWVPALYFFLSGSSDWSATPAVSRHKNHECLVLQFYDAHDLWHILSAVALYLSFNVLLTWDDGLSAVKRTDIPVF